jgi:TolB-like protein/tetratricopeptide (TPR) repeat protein
LKNHEFVGFNLASDYSNKQQRPSRSQPLQLFQELQRRNVFRVAIGYIVSSWLLAQVADLVLENIDAPDWVMQTIMLLLALGFPVVVFFSWAYEVTPEGIKRESDIDRSQSITAITSRKLDRAIVAVLIVALAYFAYDKFILDPQRDAKLVQDMEQARVEQKVADLNVSEEKITTREGPPMVAVLPFVSASLGGDSEFFATGMHDDLLTQLAQLQSIRVISRTSVLEYRDAVRNIREIGMALGADAILEGGVQSAGEKIRINVQLIDARTDQHLWAQTYDRVLSVENIFEVQTEIARAITSALQATLTVQDDTQLTVLPTKNMAAYRAYHRAMEIRDAPSVSEYDPEAFRLALEEAVALDPTFTRAWAELAGALSFVNMSDQNPESGRRAEQVLEQIQELAPKSADSLIAQAFYTYYILKDYDRAHHLITQAQSMRPSDARVVQLKSWIERRQGKFEDFIESTRLARTLDPRNPEWTRSLTRGLIMSHRYEEARLEIENSAFQDYDLLYLQGILQLSEHRDFGLWTETLVALQQEYIKIDDLNSMWEAHISNRDYSAAEQVASAMKEQVRPSEDYMSRISQKNWNLIVTYWFMQRNNRLEDLLNDARSTLNENPDSVSDYIQATMGFDLALVAAVEGNGEETEQLIRRWRRETTKDYFTELAFNLHISCRILGIAKATAAAVECIRTGLAQPSYVIPFVEPFLPYYDSMRDEPAFVDLLTELGDAANDP